MERKPVIGVVPLWDEQKDSLWMLPGYFDGIIEAGGAPLMLPLTDDKALLDRLLGLCDGLLVTGGQDVTPSVYGDGSARALALCGERCEARDRMERLAVPMAIARDMPLLGICRGLQTLNAILGGTLWQDLPTQHPSAVEHHGRPPYELPVHTVDVLEGTPLAAVVGAGRLDVNSYHHQAVRTVAPSLRAMAMAPDGLVEAVWRPDSSFVWAVQWHPEFSHAVDESSRRIFSAFVRAAARP